MAATKKTDALEPYHTPPFEPASLIEHVVDAQRVNAVFMGRVNQISVRAARILAVRQAQALRETFDDLATLVREAANGGGKTAFTDANVESLELSIARALEHIRISFDASHEMNQSTYVVLQGRLEALNADQHGARPLAAQGPAGEGRAG
jgi:hypothetical protein